MTADEFVPVGFEPPTSLTTSQFHLEPLGAAAQSRRSWRLDVEH
jgi:hypothetical protein